MTTLSRLTVSVSRRLRLAALTFIALFAVKVALAAMAPPAPVAASTPIVPAASSQGETLEQME